MSRAAAVQAFIETRDYETKAFCVTHDKNETRLFVHHQWVARNQYAPGLARRVLVNLAGNHSDTTRETLNALLRALNLNREIITLDGVHFIQSTISTPEETREEISAFEWVRI